jgi:hypothetical protein
MTVNIEMLVADGDQWNTGALYTDSGQRIGALLLIDESIVFSDIDRGIHGLIPADYRPGASVRERVMRGYMHGEVEYWRSTMTDWESLNRLKEMASRRAATAEPTMKRYTGL